MDFERILQMTTSERNLALLQDEAFVDDVTEFLAIRQLYNAAIIAIFKIKAYSRMNGTNPHSPVELQPEMHAESHLEEHPMSLL